jgi:hypothetical protein
MCTMVDRRKHLDFRCGGFLLLLPLAYLFFYGHVFLVYYHLVLTVCCHVCVGSTVEVCVLRALFHLALGMLVEASLPFNKGY